MAAVIYYVLSNKRRFCSVLFYSRKKELVQLCKEIYNTGVWPEDFCIQTAMVPLKEKPNAMTREDHRTISLLTCIQNSAKRPLKEN